MQGLMGAREWMALSLVPKLGAARIHRMHALGLAWPDGWLAQLSVSQRSYLRYLLSHGESHAEMVLGLGWEDPALERYLLFPGHPCWPALLNEIDDPPPVLWATGNLDLLQRPALAIVGSRSASLTGLRRALDFSATLAAAGICIVSGLARGIDAAAHQGALEANGYTIGVLGCGIDVVYPPRNRSLHERLTAPQGLRVTEFLPGTPARAAFFPRRNRIVTALSRGVLVIEASLRSGSLISARLALEQNREVFALPGECDNPRAQGCLWLIQEGAQLVTSPRQIIDEPGLWKEPLEALECDAPPHELPAIEGVPYGGKGDQRLALLSAYLSDTPASLDTLAATTALGPAECQRMLLWLEVQGKAAHSVGGWVRGRHGAGFIKES